MMQSIIGYNCFSINQYQFCMAMNPGKQNLSTIKEDDGENSRQEALKESIQLKVLMSKPSLSQQNISSRQMKIQKINMLKQETMRQKEQATYIHKLKTLVRSAMASWCPKSRKAGQTKSSLNTIRELGSQRSSSGEILDMLEHLSSHERMEKAVRHFYDGYLLRTPRNDLDGPENRVIRIIWTIINNSIWNHFLWLVALSYQMLVFAEPTYKGSEQTKNHIDVFVVEIFLLFFISVDYMLLLLFIIRTNQLGKEMHRNKKFIFKSIFIILLYADLINHIIALPQTSLRFARCIRAFQLISYSKDLRRNIKGILDSIQILLVLFILYFIIIAIWAFVGINLIGDLEGQIPIDSLTVNYGDFGHMSIMLYLLSTLDYFPDIVQPTQAISEYYQIYFLVFLLLFLFIFIPIPQALVYEVFRVHRKEIHKRDHEKQKQALKLCFLCLVPENSDEIPYDVSYRFFRIIYGTQAKQEDIDHLIKLLDFDESGACNIDEFYHVFLICHSFQRFTLGRWPSLKIWDDFMGFLDRRFDLKNFVEGVRFNSTTTLITLINCLLIIISLFINDTEAVSVIQTLDSVFFAFYVTEVLIKICGMGVYDYFCDTWNKFDFSLVCIQFFFDYVLLNTISQNFSSSIKANRVLRLAKFQKVFRLLKAVRSLKILSIIFDSIDIFTTVNNIFYKIIKSVPVVFRFCVIIWVIIYCYAVVAVEFLNSEMLYNDRYNPYSGNQCSPEYFENLSTWEGFIWTNCQFSTFDSIPQALMLLVQVLIFNWSTLVNNYAHGLQNYWIPSFFFGSFALITTFLMALISGLVWEIFNNIVSSEEEEDGFKQFIEEKERKYCEEDVSESKSSLSDKQEEIQPRTINRLVKEEENENLIMFTLSDDFNKMNIEPETREEDIEEPDEEEISQAHLRDSQVKQRQNNSFIRYCQLKTPIQQEYDQDQDNDQDHPPDPDQEHDQEFEGDDNHQLLDMGNDVAPPLDSQQLVSSKGPEHPELVLYRKMLIRMQPDQIHKHYPTLQERLERQQMNQTQLANKYFTNEDLLALSQTEQDCHSSRENEIYQSQRSLVYNFTQIIKNPISCKYLIDSLIGVESMITKKFLTDKSFTKFIYQVQNKHWFTICKSQNKVMFQTAGSGPWDHPGLLQREQTSIVEDNIYLTEIVFPTVYGSIEQQLSNTLKDLSKEIILRHSNLKKTYTKARPVAEPTEFAPYYLFICVFTPPGARSYITSMMSIWFVKSTPQLTKVMQRMSLINTLRNQSGNYALVNFIDTQTSTNNQTQKENNIQKDVLTKHDVPHAVQLMKELWVTISPNEEAIRQRVSELCQQRQKVSQAITTLNRITTKSRGSRLGHLQ